MIKKSLSLLSLVAVLAGNACAQDFVITANPVDSTTAGTAIRTPSMETSPAIKIVTYLKNTSSSAYMVSWTFISDTADHPPGWKLTGICDNANCRTEDYPWYTQHVTQQTIPIQPNENCLMEANVYAPYTAPNGTAVFKVKVNSPNQTDTIVYILNKNTTGISLIQADDKRVSLYPNPAAKELLVYTDKSLSVNTITVLSLSGREQMCIAVPSGRETTSLDVARLPAGCYLLRLNDGQGRNVTFRKWIKQ